MFRYRCPHCTKLLQAPDVRAGKTTVCSKCSQPLTIPADKAEWLNERGEPLLASPTVVIRTPAPTPEPAPPVPKAETDNDVLGALVAGDLLPPRTGPQTPDFNLDVANPAGMSSALNALLGHSDPAFPSSPPPAPESIVAPLPEPAAPLTPPPEPAAPPAVVAASPLPPDQVPTPPPPERTKFPTPPPRALPRRATVTGEPAGSPAAVATPPQVARPAPRPGTVQPFAPPVSASGQPDWETPAQGSPRPRRLVGTTPAPPRRTADEAAAETLTGPSQLDVAVQLSSALAARMKPRPRPRRDLHLSTALWLLATGTAAGLLLITLFTPRDFARPVLVIGILEVFAGYLWIVSLAAQRDWVRGVLAAVPPLTAYYLGQWKYARLRPLRFVVTGAILVAGALLAGAALPHTRTWAGVTAPEPEAPAEPDVAARRKVDQLRHYRDNRNYAALAKLLRELAATDAAYSAEAKDRAELRAETKALCDHPDAEVKVEALAAFTTWGESTEAMERCLAAVRTDNPEARLMALQLLPRWKTDRVAGAIVARMQQRPGLEATAAQKALVELGGPVAERAAIPLLGDQYDQNVRLAAADVLADERVASPSAAAALRAAAAATADPAVRTAATSAAVRIETRLSKKP